MSDVRERAGGSEAGADPLSDDWDVPPRVPSTPELHLDGFDGPLDMLLDLVERQRIDFGRLSISTMVEQFVSAMERFADRVTLERRADWLVMTSRLLLLRSRLFSSTSAETKSNAEDETRERGSREHDRHFIRAAVAWLDARPQLGRDVFARPSEPNPRVSSYMDLMEACLAVLQLEEDRATASADGDVVLRIPCSTFFPIQTTLRAMRARLAVMSGPEALASFVPALSSTIREQAFASRCATSSAFAAALEVARTGEAEIYQDTTWSSLFLCPMAIAAVTKSAGKAASA